METGVIQKVLVFCNAIKFGLCSPTFRQCCLLQGGMLKVEFVICRRMQLMQTVSACQDVCARDHKNEKSRLIPRGASVLNLKMSLISSRCVRSLCSSPPFTTATRMSSSEWLGPLKCCATGRSSLLCSTSRRCSLERSANRSFRQPTAPAGHFSLQADHLPYLPSHHWVHLNFSARRTHEDHRAFHVHFRKHHLLYLLPEMP